MVVKRFTNKKGKQVKKTKKIMRGGSGEKPLEINTSSNKLGQLSIKAKNTFKNKLKRGARKTLAGIVTTGLMPAAVGIGAVDHGLRYLSRKFRKQPSITESTTNSETKPMTFKEDVKGTALALYRTLAGTGLSKSTKTLISNLYKKKTNIKTIAEQIPANRLKQALKYYEAQKGNPFANTDNSEKHELYKRLDDSKQKQEK
jgi:hypothetical protein